LILRFYVHGRGKDEPEPLGYLKQSLHSAEEWALWALESVGIDLNAKREEPAVEEKVNVAQSTEGEGSGWLRSAFGSFSSLRTPAGSPVQQGKQRGLPPPGTYKSGEVTADYVKVSLTHWMTNRMANVC
jgi:import inner membrane translocase subunit TIM21